MTEGPLRQEDVAGHRHLLSAILAFEEAYANLLRQMPHPREFEALTRESRQVVDLFKVSMSLVAEPVKRVRLMRPRASIKQMREIWKQARLSNHT